MDVKPPRKKPNRFNRVFVRSGERVRGLRERNGAFYAQIRAGGRKVRLRLEHAETVPQAIEEMQVLKRKRRQGTLEAPRRKAAPTTNGAQPAENGAQRGGPSLSDYMRLLGYSGGREQEKVQLRWSNVHWERRCLHFPGASQGAKRGGGSAKAGGPRGVDFFGKLESHLKAMKEQRDPSTDLMFPSVRGEGPVKCFRKQLSRVKKETGIAEVTFQCFRQYFISHCVMAGVDFMTIAKWVGHRHGGVLIGRLYGHLSREHPQQMAKRLDQGF